MNKLNRWETEIEANVVRAAALVDPHDPGEVSAFCSQLSRAEGHDEGEIAADLRGTRLPGGFMHVGAFDKRTVDPIAGAYSTTDEPVEARGVLGCALAVVGNDAMPVTRPGVLDLAIGCRVPPHVAAARG